MALALNKLKRRLSTTVSSTKPKRKIDRFDGLTEEEVQKYTLEDILQPGLDLVFVGINPSLMAAHRGRYYAGPGNHFYKLLHESKLVPRFVSFEEDRRLLDHKIGLTNIVARATRSSADLKRIEIKRGTETIREKLMIFKPRIAVFNGKCIYEVFGNKNGKSEFFFGLQPETVGETALWVVPSSSARCAHFPRMTDKLHFYTALKKYLSFLKGEIGEIDPAELKFDGKCKQSVPSTSKMWRRKNVSAFVHGGRVANENTVRFDGSDDNLATVRSTEFIVTRIIRGTNDDCEETSPIENGKNFEKISRVGNDFADNEGADASIGMVSSVKTGSREIDHRENESLGKIAISGVAEEDKLSSRKMRILGDAEEDKISSQKKANFGNAKDDKNSTRKMPILGAAKENKNSTGKIPIFGAAKDDKNSTQKIPVLGDPKEETSSKRSLKRSPVSRISSEIRDVDVDGQSTDFMNIIKQRLSKKKEPVKIDDEIVECPPTKPLEKEPKLKYANLRLNRARKNC